MSGRGKRVNSTAKSIIWSVYKYFKKQQAKSKRSYGDIVKKTMEATAFSRSTVFRVLKEKDKIGDRKFKSPKKRYNKSRVIVSVDDFDVAAIRRTVHEFYDCKEYPTITKLLSMLKDKELFYCRPNNIVEIT